jgi:hypothetical protein
MCSHYVPNVFFQVPNMFPIAAHFYLILFFSFGEGRGSWIFVVQKDVPTIFATCSPTSQDVPNSISLLFVQRCDLVIYIGGA